MVSLLVPVDHTVVRFNIHLVIAKVHCSSISLSLLNADGSPGSVTSTGNQLWALARILLDLMLQKVSLSKAEYHLGLCKDSKIWVTVLFNISSSKLSLEGTNVYT